MKILKKILINSVAHEHIVENRSPKKKEIETNLRAQNMEFKVTVKGGKDGKNKGESYAWGTLQNSGEE